MRVPRFGSALASRWRGEGGYRALLIIAAPLVLSTGSWSLQHFVDRMFLTWYSPEAVAASMPAGILNFTLVALFQGTAAYVNTFVAQYYGAGRPERIGPAMWQGIYVALAGGIVIVALLPLSEAFIRSFGHDPKVQEYELTYFRILSLGAVAPTLTHAVGSFLTGRGRTWPIMWATLLATGVNLVLDYAMIFGRWGFPEMGVAGAAIATVIAGLTGLLFQAVLVFNPAADRVYHTLRGWRPDLALLRRLLRYGLPSGVQFFIDMFGFSLFILLMGRLGTTSLAATNIAFNINTLAFMPMIGVGIAVSVLVGQALGKDRPDLAERSVYSAAHLTFLYMALLAALYVLVPGLFVAPFAARADAGNFSEIRHIAVMALRFVAVYSLFDSLNLVFSSALKGAGDTRYIMFVIAGASAFVLVLPAYVALVMLDANVFVGWAIASAYVVVMGLAFLARFLTGKWKAMRVIEPAVVEPVVAAERQAGGG